MIAAISRPMLKDGPVNPAMLYLGIGWLMSPQGLGYLALDPVTHASVLERISELAVVVSLFVCGLKIQVRSSDRLWLLPLRLAFVAMAITVALVTLAGHFLLGFPLGVALILGAIMAPTDPVLASEVQVENIHDRDQVRFSLTGEAGFNDGAAFPFLFLGLGVLGLHHLGPWGLSWWTVDVIWGILGGLALGAMFGCTAGLLVRSLRTGNQQEGVQEFLAFGLVFAAYGAALALHTLGFLAAFAAGLALRWMEVQGHPDEGAMAHGVLGFKERVERLLEAVMVILVGALVATLPWDPNLFWFAPLLFLVLRPLAVSLGLLGTPLGRMRRAYLSWFGIRGIGSVYYLSYAASHGLAAPYIQQLAGIVYPILAVSILVHGLSVSPLMAKYTERVKEAEKGPEPSPPLEPDNRLGAAHSI